jgi:hypothetical protein
MKNRTRIVIVLGAAIVPLLISMLIAQTVRLDKLPEPDRRGIMYMTTIIVILSAFLIRRK